MREKRNIIGERMRIARHSEQPKAPLVDISARLEVMGVKLSVDSLSKIELGQRPVTDKQLVAIARALKVSTSWLLKETNERR